MALNLDLIGGLHFEFATYAREQDTAPTSNGIYLTSLTSFQNDLFRMSTPSSHGAPTWIAAGVYAVSSNVT